MRVTLPPLAQFVEQSVQALLLCSHVSRTKDQKVRNGGSDRVVLHGLGQFGVQRGPATQVVDGRFIGKDTGIGSFHSRPSVRRARAVGKRELRFFCCGQPLHVHASSVVTCGPQGLWISDSGAQQKGRSRGIQALGVGRGQSSG